MRNNFSKLSFEPRLINKIHWTDYQFIQLKKNSLSVLTNKLQSKSRPSMACNNRHIYNINNRNGNNITDQELTEQLIQARKDLKWLMKELE